MDCRISRTSNDKCAEIIAWVLIHLSDLRESRAVPTFYFQEKSFKFNDTLTIASVLFNFLLRLTIISTKQILNVVIARAYANYSQQNIFMLKSTMLGTYLKHREFLRKHSNSFFLDLIMKTFQRVHLNKKIVNTTKKMSLFFVDFLWDSFCVKNECRQRCKVQNCNHTFCIMSSQKKCRHNDIQKKVTLRM